MDHLKEQVNQLIPFILRPFKYTNKKRKSALFNVQPSFDFLSVTLYLFNPGQYLIFAVFILFTTTTIGQEAKNSKSPVFISGAVGITHNGISLVPSFSLEQPAAIINLELEKGRFSIEPELTFSLQEGRPWYQLYWLRYKLADGQKFKFRTGAHLGLNFIKVLNAELEEVIQNERYLTAELAPSYQLTENISLGLYYLISRGFDIDNSVPLHFLTFNASFENLKLSKTLFLEITPELYYLSSFGDGEGIYFTSFIKLSKVDFPLSLSSRINTVLSTEIEGKDFLWNLSLTYTFRKGKITF